MAPAADILDSDPDSVASGDNEEDDYGNLENKQKCEKSIAAATI